MKYRPYSYFDRDANADFSADTIYRGIVILPTDNYDIDTIINWYTVTTSGSVVSRMKETAELHVLYCLINH